MKSIIIVTLSFVCMAIGFAQQASPEPDAVTIRVSSQFVVLDALVESKTGQAIGNLEAKDFSLTEDGVRQNVSYFTSDQLPLSIVFLFDLTETVQPILEPLAAGAGTILGHLKPQDEVSVMVFSSHTRLLQSFTTDRTLAAQAIEKASKMKSKDGTFIHEDMYEAVDEGMKSTLPESRRVLVWLTDGTANLQNSLTQQTIGKEAPTQLHNREEATSSLVHSGITVAALIDRSAKTDAFVVAMDINPFAFIAGARVGDIRRYADLTGGPILSTSKKNVAIRLAELIDHLRQRYTLGYKPLNSRPPGTYCKLHLALDPVAYKERIELPKGGVLIRTKHGYYR